VVKPGGLGALVLVENEPEKETLELKLEELAVELDELTVVGIDAEEVVDEVTLAATTASAYVSQSSDELREYVSLMLG
jgi:hypothetical protein